MIKILLPISLIGLIIIFGVYFANIYYNNSYYSTLHTKLTSKPVATSSATQTKLFKSSKSLKFTIEIPSNYTAEEKLGAVTITSADGTKIYIDTNGTNYTELSNYVKLLESRNHFILSGQKNLKINNIPSISGTTTTEKIYFIYPEGTWSVYSISTTSNNLYPALDQIAQSFKYTP